MLKLDPLLGTETVMTDVSDLGGHKCIFAYCNCLQDDATRAFEHAPHSSDTFLEVGSETCDINKIDFYEISK